MTRLIDLNQADTSTLGKRISYQADNIWLLYLIQFFTLYCVYFVNRRNHNFFDKPEVNELLGLVSMANIRNIVKICAEIDKGNCLE